MENQNSPVKVYAVFQIHIICGGSCPDSLELDSLFFSKLDAEKRVAELGGPEEAYMEERKVQ